MPVDKATIYERLDKLSQVIKLLEKYRATPREDFLTDFTINSAAQYNLILGIEIIVDIGSHLLSEAFQVHASEYRQVIELLGEYEVLPREFAEENIPMARFRNLIIHQYEQVDMAQVYENLQKAPGVLNQFAKYFTDFIENKS